MKRGRGERREARQRREASKAKGRGVGQGLVAKALMHEEPWKPTKQQLEDAAHKRVPDLIKPDLEVLFCGINPGLYTAAIGHHFGRPGNRFWKVLHLAGFTSRQLSPFEESELLDSGVGIINVVERPTRTAAELSKDEYEQGARAVVAKLRKYKPKVLAVVGVQAYRIGFNQPKAQVGEQPDKIGNTAVWALPNPSGLQAHYLLADMVELYSDMRKRSLLDS